MSDSIAFLHAHPDDEAIFTGGTMRRLADAGTRVLLIVATSGDQGLGAEDALLAQRREAETLQACAALGVEHVHFLRYGDSGADGDAPPGSFAVTDLDEMARRVIAILDDEHTRSLVVYDEGGIYSHPDHVKVHEVGTAVAALGAVDRLYQATVDHEYLHFVETHIVEQAALDVLGDLRVGLPSVLIDVCVDVRSRISEKRAAMVAHASQLPASLFALRDEVFTAVYGYEWYVRIGPKGCIDELR